MKKFKLINKTDINKKDLGLEMLVNDYKQLNEIGRAKANEYLNDVLTQIDKYTGIVSTIVDIKEIKGNVIYADFKRESKCC